MDEDEVLTILQPLGYNASTCGYCGPPGRRSTAKSSRSYGLWAHQLSPRIYKLLIDRGWRRSGSYLYKPDLSPARSCCPAYTIRCDVDKFKASKSQRQAVNRFVRFVKEGDEREGEKGKGFGCAAEEGQEGEREAAGMSSMDVEFPAPRTAVPALDGAPVASGSKSTVPPKLSERKRQKPPPGNTFDLEAAFAVAETYKDGDRHRFEIEWEPASLTDEKFELYKKYQIRVHNDPPAKVTSTSFDRFLCSNPFPTASSSNGLPTSDGAYHVLYRLDGRLIAFAVLDVLPDCLSSVYFVWDPDFAGLGLGKVGALREIAAAQEMGLEWYYMGFYIHSCVKMRYKGEYSASFLADPHVYSWHPLEACRALLDADSHATFASPSTTVSTSAPQPASTNGSAPEDDNSEEDEDTDMPTDPPPSGVWDPQRLPATLLARSMVFNPTERIKLLLNSKAWRNAESQRSAREALAALGEDIGSQVVLYLG